MRPVMGFSQASLSFTLIALDNTKISLKKAGKAAVDAAGGVLFKRVKQEIGMRDHSLTDLANYPVPGGHPYARRHGSIRIHTNTPWRVHRKPSGGLTGAAKTASEKRTAGHRVQSDRMYQTTFGRPITTPSGAPGYEVGFDTAAAPEAIAVTQGTRLMLPRDPLWITANMPDVRKEMMTAIVRRLGKDLRSKVGIRFGAGVPSGTSTKVR